MITAELGLKAAVGDRAASVAARQSGTSGTATTGPSPGVSTFAPAPLGPDIRGSPKCTNQRRQFVEKPPLIKGYRRTPFGNSTSLIAKYRRTRYARLQSLSETQLLSDECHAVFGHWKTSDAHVTAGRNSICERGSSGWSSGLTNPGRCFTRSHNMHINGRNVSNA